MEGEKKVSVQHGTERKKMWENEQRFERDTARKTSYPHGNQNEKSGIKGVKISKEM